VLFGKVLAMFRVVQRLGHLLIGWAVVGVFLYSSWRIPRLPFILDLVGQLPLWVIIAGVGAWAIAVLGLVGAGFAPRRAWSRPGLVLGSQAAAVVLVVFPVYLLYRGEGWQNDLALAVGFFWILCVLLDKIAFLILARRERGQNQ